MNDSARRMQRDQVLFCPFCRESFEAARACPDHELPLVPWHELPPEHPRLTETTRLGPYSLSAGRGWVFAGALLSLIAFVLPMLTLTGDTELHANMLRFASLRSPKLWMVPLSAVALWSVLMRRRTPTALRGARVAVACLGLMPSVALGLTLRGVYQAAAVVAERTAAPTLVTIEYGSYLVGVASIVTLVGAVRLGVVTTGVQRGG